jgi:hypothetical protein
MSFAFQDLEVGPAVRLFFAAVGAFLICAVYCDWNWVIDTRRNRILVELLGSRLCRMLWAVSGVCGILLYWWYAAS